MKYVYPAIFTPLADGEFDVVIPALSGCRTCGNSLADTILMAEDAVSMWLWDAEIKSEPIPSPDVQLQFDAPQFMSYVVADTNEYRKKFDNKAIKKTLTIPNWLNTKAEQEEINFSQILQEALKEKLHLNMD